MTFVHGTADNYVEGGHAVSTRPTGTTDGDQLIAAVIMSSLESIPTPPSGWTHVETQAYMAFGWFAALYRKTAASEPATTTFTLSPNNHTGQVVQLAYRNVEWDTYDMAQTAVDISNPETAAIVPSVNGCDVVGMFLCLQTLIDTATPDTSPSCTERVENDEGSTPSFAYVEDFNQSTAASVSLGCTANDVSADNWATVIISLKPAAVQTLAPSADSVDGNWTNQAGSATDLFDAINETTASDTDYIRSELAPANSATRIKLASGGDPASSTGHEINWRIAKDAAGGQTIGMIVKLYQGGGNSVGGGTLIASFTRSNVTNTFTDFAEALSAGEADSITNYGDLYLEFWANAT